MDAKPMTYSVDDVQRRAKYLAENTQRQEDAEMLRDYAALIEAFDISVTRAGNIMRLARAISLDADAIECSENDSRREHKLPIREVE